MFCKLADVAPTELVNIATRRATNIPSLRDSLRKSIDKLTHVHKNLVRDSEHYDHKNPSVIPFDLQNSQDFNSKPLNIQKPIVSTFLIFIAQKVDRRRRRAMSPPNRHDPCAFERRGQ